MKLELSNIGIQKDVHIYIYICILGSFVWATSYEGQIPWQQQQPQQQQQQQQQLCWLYLILLCVSVRRKATTRELRGG